MEYKVASSDKTEGPPLGTVPSIQQGQVEDPSSRKDHVALDTLGYTSELHRNRSMLTMLFQSLAIAAIPWGFGGPLISAIYGGGQLAMFLGWVLVLIVDECVAISLAELASRYPTSAGPSYWAFRVSPPQTRTFVSFITAWAWIVGNWTIALSVNFGFASLVAATVEIYYPEYAWQSWQLLLVFYAICLVAFVIVAVGNRFLPSVDTFCAVFTVVTIVVTLICLSAKAGAGRHSVADTLGYFDKSLSGWGNFSFLIGLLPSAYSFSAIGMISSMAEECRDATRQLPKAIALSVPVGGIAGLFFIIPLCATLPPLVDILDAPIGQALPYIYQRVMETPGGGLALTILVIFVTFFASISITVACSRATWAAARDNALPLSNLLSKVNVRYGVPLWALVLTTVVQMALGLVNLGSSSAFNAFVSVGVIALAVSYGIPITLSMIGGRKQVSRANWTVGPIIGCVVNTVAVLWIAFEVVLFSMPTTLPVTEVSMNYASVVFTGFLMLSGVWYLLQGRFIYKGPPGLEC